MKIPTETRPDKPLPAWAGRSGSAFAVCAASRPRRVFAAVAEFLKLR